MTAMLPGSHPAMLRAYGNEGIGGGKY